VFQLSETEARQCCLAEDQLKLTYNDQEVGTYDVLSFRRGQRRVFIHAIEDRELFEVGIDYGVIILRNGKEIDTREGHHDLTAMPESSFDEFDDLPSGEQEAKIGPLSNSDIRGSKRGSVGLLYTPLSDFILTYGLGFGYYHNERLMFGFEVLTGNQSIGHDSSDPMFKVNRSHVSGFAAYGFSRYFIYDRLNVKAGLGHRQADLELKLTEVFGGELTYTGAVASIVVPIAIGNQWNWPNGLTLSVDWLKVMVPISGSSSNEIDTTINPP